MVREDILYHFRSPSNHKDLKSGTIQISAAHLYPQNIQVPVRQPFQVQLLMTDQARMVLPSFRAAAAGLVLQHNKHPPC